MIVRTIAAGLLTMLATAAPAQAQAGPRQTFDARFTNTAPGAATGVTLAIDYVNEDDPDAKPHAVERIVLEPPSGARIDTSVPERCTASEPELMLLGAEACPDGSRVGGGELDLATGAVPSHDRVTLLNNDEQLIFLTQPEEAPIVSLVTRAQVREDGAFVTNVPPVPGLPPPDPFTALDRVQIALNPVVDLAGRGYITTPAACPESGSWTWRASFTYRDGVTQTAGSSTPCEPVAAVRRTAGSGCLARRAAVGSLGIARIRLGHRRSRVVRRAGAPSTRARQAFRYCVSGGGRVLLAFSRRGDLRLVATTARGHAARGVRPGSSVRRLGRAFPDARSLGPGLLGTSRSSRVVFGVRRGRVTFVAVTGRRQIKRPALLRYYLAKAGLRRR